MTFNISTNPKIVANWDTINSPQAYSYKPVAAAYVSESYYIKPKESTGKKILKAVGVVAVVAAALAGARSQIASIKDININKTASNFKGMEKAKYYVAKSGQWVIDNAKKLKFWGKEASKNTKDTPKT